MDLRTEILWAEFHDGISPEKYIEGRSDFCNPNLNFERIKSWDYAARPWWVSDKYTIDRKLYKQIYDKLISFYEHGIIFCFDIDLPDYNYPWNEVSIYIDLNNEKVNTEETYVCIKGTDKTILSKVDEYKGTLKHVIK